MLSASTTEDGEGDSGVDSSCQDSLGSHTPGNSKRDGRRQGSVTGKRQEGDQDLSREARSRTGQRSGGIAYPANGNKGLKLAVADTRDSSRVAAVGRGAKQVWANGFVWQTRSTIEVAYFRYLVSESRGSLTQ